MKHFFCITFCMVAFFYSNAQTNRDSIIARVNQLFEGMKNADSVMVRDCFAPNAVLQTIQERNGTVKVLDEAVAEFISFVGKSTKGAADEKITVGSIQIDGPLAMVWTPYEFYYNGKFSHCGVNVFQLVRLQSGWKIQYLIDTRRKTGCVL